MHLEVYVGGRGNQADMHSGAGDADGETGCRECLSYHPCSSDGQTHVRDGMEGRVVPQFGASVWPSIGTQDI